MSTDHRIQALLARFKTPLSTNWMLAEITEAEDGVSGNGREQVSVALAPVANNYVMRDEIIRAYIPRVMDGDPPKAIKDIKRRGGGFIRAVDPDFPARPYREGKGKYVVRADQKCVDPLTGEEHTFEQGQTIGYTEYNIIGNEQDAMVLEALETLGEEEKTKALVGCRLWIKPGKAKYSEQYGVSQFVDGYAMDLPDGKEAASTEDEILDQARKLEMLTDLGVNLGV